MIFLITLANIGTDMQVSFIRKAIRVATRKYLGIDHRPIKMVTFPSFPGVYIQNPKSASTTIKMALRTFEALKNNFQLPQDVYVSDELSNSRLISGNEIYEKYFFSAVRNPFSRILSAYIDKRREKDGIFEAQFGNWRPDNFEQFLRALKSMSPLEFNPHFSPQYLNLGYPNNKYNFIFYVEDIIHFFSLIELLGCSAEDLSIVKQQAKFKNSHQTNSNSLANEFFDNTNLELVREIFQKDFDYFNYSYDYSIRDQNGYLSYSRYEKKHTNRIELNITDQFDLHFNKEIFASRKYNSLIIRKII